MKINLYFIKNSNNFVKIVILILLIITNGICYANDIVFIDAGKNNGVEYNQIALSGELYGLNIKYLFFESEKENNEILNNEYFNHT